MSGQAGAHPGHGVALSGRGWLTQPPGVPPALRSGRKTLQPVVPKVELGGEPSGDACTHQATLDP